MEKEVWFYREVHLCSMCLEELSVERWESRRKGSYSRSCSSDCIAALRVYGLIEHMGGYKAAEVYRKEVILNRISYRILSR